MFFQQESEKTEDESNRSDKDRLKSGAKRKKDDGWGGESWHGYMREKERKLQEQFENLNNKDNLQEKSDIFNGVCIFVNGYTNPSSDQLKQIMAENGGQYQHYYHKKKCTHIIATNLPDSKIKQLKDEKVVHPDWILESVKSGRLLSVEKYRLYWGKKEAKAFMNFQPKEICSKSKESVDNDNSPLDSPAETEPVIQNALANATFSSLPLSDKHVNCPSTSTLPTRMPNELQREFTSLEETGIAYSKQGGDADGSLSKEDHLGSCASNDADYDSISMGLTMKDRITDSHANPELEGDYSTSGPSLTKHDYSSTSPTKTMGKAGDPGFMSEFYSNSRLHHLSMWRSELKRFATMIHKASLSKSARKRSKDENERLIMHIDLDSFFVSVALREKPDLKGKPVAVCHASKGSATASNMNSKSEIASCSYEARSRGVRNGMFLGTARKMCPELICMPYYFESYRTVSQKFYEILVSYTSEIEAVSCDEALLDVTDLVSGERTVMDLASKMRADILKQTGCSASAGIASNILLARMATRKAKPDGQFHLQKNDVLDFVGEQKVSDLPGVGYSMQSKLLAIGANTCAELRLISLQKLKEKFGPKTGQSLYNNCRGIDKRQLKTDHERQSVSAEINYGIRFVEDQEANAFLFELAKEVGERLQAIEMKGSHLTLKLMIRKKGAPESAKHMGHGICDNASKSTTVTQATDNADIIGKETVHLLQQFKIVASDIRGMGIQVSKLVNSKSASKSMRTIDFGNQTKTKCIAPMILDEISDAAPKELESHSLESKQISKPQSSKSKVPAKRGRKAKLAGRNTMNLSRFVTKVSLQDAVRNELDARNLQNSDDPPLPTLDASPTKARHPPRTNRVDLPPLSEIDPAVFYELPEDVRRSIAEAYKQRNEVLDVAPCSYEMARSNKRPEVNFSVRSETEAVGSDSHEPERGFLVPESVSKSEHRLRSNDSAYPKPVGGAIIENKNGPNMADVEDGGDNGTRAEESNDDPSAGTENYPSREGVDGSDPVMTFAEVDPDVLKALPPHIREEVLQSLKLEQRRSLRSDRRGQLQSKEKDATHGVLPKVMGLGAKETCRGMKKKVDRRKIQFEKRKAGTSEKPKAYAASTSKEIVPCSSAETIRPDSIGSHSETSKKEMVDTVVGESDLNVPKCNPSIAAVEFPSLSGESDHKQVKDLTKAWLLSTDDPLVEDVEEFTSYLEKLLGCLCMEQAFQLLKMLKRFSGKSDQWTMNWGYISDRVQTLVENRYGGTLSL